ERRARLAGALVHALPRLASLVDPLLRHLDGVGVGVPFGGVHHVWRRGYVMLVNITAVADAHERLWMPEGALRLVRLPFDLPAPVLDVFSHILAACSCSRCRAMEPPGSLRIPYTLIGVHRSSTYLEVGYNRN